MPHAINAIVLKRTFLIETDYFAGIGDQCANAFISSQNIDKSMSAINQALRFLGVQAHPGMDEFDTVGLVNIRSCPDYLDKYVEMADELGL